jgi:hypothetical protein
LSNPDHIPPINTHSATIDEDVIDGRVAMALICGRRSRCPSGDEAHDRIALRQSTTGVGDGPGNPTEEVLAEMRAAQPTIQDLVGTPRAVIKTLGRRSAKNCLNPAAGINTSGEHRKSD